MHRAWSINPFLFVALVLCIFLGYVIFRIPINTQPLPAYEFWFDDVDTEKALSIDQAGYIMREILRGTTQNDADVQKLFTEVSSDLSPQITFISASDTKTSPTVVIGTGSGLAAALHNAIVRLRRRDLASTDISWLKLDIVKRSKTGAERPASPAAIQPLHEGIAFPRPTVLAILPTQAVAWDVLDNDGNLLLENLPGSMQYRLAPPWRLAAARHSEFMRIRLSQAISPQGFATHSYFFDGKETFRLSHGQRILDQTLALDVTCLAITETSAAGIRQLPDNGCS